MELIAVPNSHPLGLALSLEEQHTLCVFGFKSNFLCPWWK